MIRDPEMSCPDQSDLKRFVKGDLGDDEFDCLAKHIDRCDPCGVLIDQMFGLKESDLSADLLQLSEGDLKSSLGQPVPTRLLKKIIDLSPDPAETGSKSKQASFDAGQRLANSLKDGNLRLGRFELKSELGVGTFGYVFKALDMQLDRLVALKVQRAGSFASEEDVHRFLREAQSIAKLNHPRIVSLYDSIQTAEGICYLVTEYVDGQSLESYLQDQEFTFQDGARIVADIADALQYAHDKGIVHRDVKPSNVLLDNDGIPHLADFGLAKREWDTTSVKTAKGTVMGTPAYMSPEQVLGNSKNVDARSDVYSLGVILYEILTGEYPFSGQGRLLLLQVLEDLPRPPRDLQPEVPKDLETICLKALSKSPGRRYSSAAFMAEDIRRFLKGLPIKARPMGRTEKLTRWCRSYPVAASLLIAVPLVAIGGFAYLSQLSTHFVRTTALESARMEANMLEDINNFYSEKVIAELDREKIPVTHQYTTTKNAVPLPFTFMIDAGKRITENESGVQVKIYSEFPWRKDGGPRNDFEKRASKALSCRVFPEDQSFPGKYLDDRSYYEFDQFEGQPVLRYARAQIMKQSCVDCHNNDSGSPRKDWQVGEVGGVLLVTRPLVRDIALTRQGLRSAFVLIGSVAFFLTGLTFFVFVMARFKGQYQDLDD